MGRTIAKVSEQTLKLQSFLEKKKVGEELSYARIEQETGVAMDSVGKQFLRTAMKRAKLEYSAIRGWGVQLASPDTTMGIVTNRLLKIDRSVRRADKTHTNLHEQFFSSLSTQEQKELLYIGAVFGAIRVAASNGKVMYSKNKHELSESINIPVPKMI